MKIVTISYLDSVDTTAIEVNTEPVTISDGTNTIEGGRLMARTQMANPEVVPHSHKTTVGVVVGPAVPS